MVQLLSRKRFVALYAGSVVSHWADRDFDRFSGPGKGHIDPNIVTQDLEKLKKLGLKCEEFADKRIAHYDERAPKNLATFNELDACIDYLEELLKKYWLLFRAAVLLSVLPTWQDDWQEIFQEPWLPPHLEE